MNTNDFIPLLGAVYGDDKVHAFLTAVGIKAKPRFKRGEFDAIVLNHATGVEVTFTDERFLDVRRREYDDGELVLSNIRLYGDGNDSFRRFKGEAFHKLSFDMDRKAALKAVGRKPSAENSERTIARWDLKGYCLFTNFDARKTRLLSTSVQLPVE